MKNVVCFRTSSLLAGIWIYLTLAIGAISCNHEESTPWEPIDYEQFTGLIYSRSITLEEAFRDAVRQYNVSEETLKPHEKNINLLLSLRIEYEAHAIRYQTKDPHGNPIEASGVIYYPKKGRPKGVIEFSPISKIKNECASRHYLAAEVIPGMINNYICLLPDLIGYGETENLPITYLQHDNIALISADLRRAAEEFVHNHYQTRLSRQSILFGYSLGGSGIWALARYYQQHPDRGVSVTEIFSGGGAYAPLKILEELFSSGYSGYAIVPNILYSLDYYENLNLNFPQIFKGELLNNYQKWCDGYTSIHLLTDKLGTDLYQYMQHSFWNDNNSPEFQRLVAALQRKEIPNDWIPKCKVHLFHVKDDDHVPIVCSNQLYEYLQSVGADVSYTIYETSHLEGGFLMAINFGKYLFKG